MSLSWRLGTFIFMCAKNTFSEGNQTYAGAFMHFQLSEFHSTFEIILIPINRRSNDYGRCVKCLFLGCLEREFDFTYMLSLEKTLKSS